MRSPAFRKWQRLTRRQLDSLVEVISSVRGSNATFEEFAEFARSSIESIPGLETLTESQASELVNYLWRDYMAKKPSKTKQSEKPAKKQKKDEVQKSAEASAPTQANANAGPRKLDLDKPAVKKAIEEGQAVLKEGKSKADAAWAIYGRLKDEDKELIVGAFIKGATLTEKGALTYWYNCKRRAAKEAQTK